MPEALVVLAVFAIAVAAWFGAWRHARNPANFSPHEERERLQQQAAWLEQRLAVARNEHWDKAMIEAIENERAALAPRLARCKAPPAQG